MNDDKPSDQKPIDKKGLLNEVLPAPTEKVGEGSPRQRTSDHLRRLLAAAGVALHMQGVAYAETALPKEDDKTPKRSDPAPPTPPDPPGYGVVDPLPPPVDRKHESGALELASNPPGARITVDGDDLGTTTPAKIVLAPGKHTVSLVLADKNLVDEFTVTLKPGKTIKEKRKLKPKKAR